MDLGAGVGLEWKPLIDLIPSPAKRSPFDIIFIKSIFEQLLNFSRCAISKASKNGIFDLFLSICLRRRNCCQMCALIVFWECSEDQFGPTKKRSTIFFSKIHRPLPIRENPRSAPADIEATRGGSRIFSNGGMVDFQKKKFIGHFLDGPNGFSELFQSTKKDPV